MKTSLLKHISVNNAYLWKSSNKIIAEMADYYGKFIDDSKSELLIVKDNKSATYIGMGLGRILFHDQYIPSKSGRIDDIWLEPDYRRKGILKKLLSILIDFFYKNEIESLILDYTDGNNEAESVWPLLGFHPTLITATANIKDVKNNLI